MTSALPVLKLLRAICNRRRQMAWRYSAKRSRLDSWYNFATERAMDTA